MFPASGREQRQRRPMLACFRRVLIVCVAGGRFASDLEPNSCQNDWIFGAAVKARLINETAGRRVCVFG
jgi:hypothetical protein